jgi:tetratricopeptide (TPR) repeat protein
MRVLTRPTLDPWSGLIRRGRLEEARKGLVAACEEDAEDIELLYLLFRCYMADGNMSGCDDVSNRLLAFGSEDVRSYFARAWYFFETDQAPIGRYHVKKAHGLDPDNPDVLLLFARYALYDGDAERALFLADAALESDPKSVEAVQFKLDAITQISQNEKVVQHQQQVIADDTAYQATQTQTEHFNLESAWKLLHNNEFDKANTAFLQLLSQPHTKEMAGEGLLETIRRSWKPYQTFHRIERKLGDAPTYVFWAAAIVLWLIIQTIARLELPTNWYWIPGLAFFILILLWISQPVGWFILQCHKDARPLMDDTKLRSGRWAGLPLVLAVVFAPISLVWAVAFPLSLIFLAISLSAGICYRDGSQPDKYLTRLFIALVAVGLCYALMLLGVPKYAVWLAMPFGVLFMVFQLVYTFRYR